MKNVIKEYLLLVLIFLGGCQSDVSHKKNYIIKSINENSFKEVVTLEAEPASKINSHLINPGFTFVLDSLLIVYERNVDNGFIKIFSLKDNAYLQGFGKRGRGPKEFSNVLQNFVETTGTKSLKAATIFDWGNARLVEWNIDSSLNRNLLKINQSYTLPPKTILAQRAIFINDSTIVGTGGIDKGSMFFANTQNDSIWYSDLIPPLSEEIGTQKDIAELYRSEFAVNYTKDLIVLSNKWFNQISFFDTEGTPKKIIKGKGNVLLKENSEMNRILYYKDMGITEKYIYAVYLNMSYNQMKKARESYDSNGKTYSTEIHVFDWEGNPVRKLIMKDKFLQFIDVDPQNHRIYSLDTFSNSKLIFFENKLIE